MSKVWITSDLHLGHNNIHKYRQEFKTAEQHHETIFENLATAVNKRDVLYLLGDVCFSKEWLKHIKEIKCVKKVLVVGNHDLEFGIHMRHLVDTYDQIYSLHQKKGFWLTHCPMHPQEIRGRKGNIHGHLHGKMVWEDNNTIDTRYINVCVEHTDWKPADFTALIRNL